jgi:predicted lipoprotein with Yx(FWY)xxD motif
MKGARRVEGRSAPRRRRSRSVVRLVTVTVVASATAAALVTGCQESPPAKRGEPAGWIPSALPVYTASVQPAAVRTREVEGYSRILTTTQGLSIYVNNEPTNSRNPVCTGSCTSVWHPVLVDLGDLVDPGTLGVRISTIDRPGQGHQLAVNGQRAYTFAADRPGELQGDLFITGSRTGRTYTWRAVRVPHGAPDQVVFKPRK